MVGRVSGCWVADGWWMADRRWVLGAGWCLMAVGAEMGDAGWVVLGGDPNEQDRFCTSQSGDDPPTVPVSTAN